MAGPLAITRLSICVALAMAFATPAWADPPRDRIEPGAVPILAGDSDVGFKFGAFVHLARYEGDVRPFVWRTQLFAAMSVLDGASGAEFPYREVAVRFDRPHAFVDRLRLTFDLQYLRAINFGYYGIGNASLASPIWVAYPEGSDDYVRARHFYQYDGAWQNIRVAAREDIAPGWSRFGNLSVSRAVVRAYDRSLLARDIRTARGVAALHATGDATFFGIGFGFAFDTRDHEVVTTRGQFHELAFRLVPAALGADPYLGATVVLRGYLPIVGERLSVAGRLLGDALTRNAPLYELSRYGGINPSSGPGGGRGVRGVPEGRLSGRTKLIENVEVRSYFLPFAIGSQHFTAGLAGFFDSGRVWTDTLASVPALDGDPWRLYWGVGGGPRLRWGDGLVIRADMAYSPLGAALGSSPGLYLDFDQVM